MTREEVQAAAVTFPCAWCGAKAGRLCVRKNGSRMPLETHSVRWAQGRELVRRNEERSKQ